MSPISLIQLRTILLLLLHLCHHSKLQPTKVLQSLHRSLGWQCGNGCLRPSWTQLKIQNSGRRMLRGSYLGMLTRRAVSCICGKSVSVRSLERKEVCNSRHVFAVTVISSDRYQLLLCSIEGLSVINVDLNPLSWQIFPLLPCLICERDL